MPRPIPDYIPETLKTLLSAHPRGLSSLAQEIGVPYRSMVTALSRGRHKGLERFVELAEFLEISPDKLVKVLEVEPKYRKDVLAQLLGTDSDIKHILEQGGEGFYSYLYGLLRGTCGSSIGKLYSPMAKELDISLTELSRMLVV